MNTFLNEATSYCKVTIKRITHYLFTLLLVGVYPTLGFASHEKENTLTAASAFQTINSTLFKIEETRDYCNKHFNKQINRNNEAYDQWELQYSFFLREFDNNYANWKRGFTDIEREHFTSLDAIEREKVKRNIAKELAKGGLDKCYTYKPSLFRPRNNLELAHQEEVNFIRNEALGSFTKARESTGADPDCVWDQNMAIKTITLRNEGKDQKFQKTRLKELKKANTDTDKKQKERQLKSYSSMISEVYTVPNMQVQSYSQYRFTRCQRDNESLESIKFKKSAPAILECQTKAKELPESLGACINKALFKK